MKHGSLFSGIGGFDLAAEWMGWENKFHCEWNEFGQRVLHHYWPQAELFTDITKSDFTKYANTIDVLTGGFPCQPYSAAGKRLGKEDERHLWPEMLRAIREIAPRYVVGENVRGLTNWNGGLVFDEVCADLENLGYQVAPYLIPACATNAPHKRERIWFVAYSDGCRSHREKKYENCNKDCRNWKQSNNIDNNGKIWRNASDSDRLRQLECEREHEEHASQARINALDDADANDERGNASDAPSKRLERMPGKKGRCSKLYRGSNGLQHWQNFPTQPPICGGDDGLPTELDGITFPKWRNESIKAYGNAVVPQVVYEIFKAIESYETIRHSKRERTSR